MYFKMPDTYICLVNISFLFIIKRTSYSICLTPRAAMLSRTFYVHNTWEKLE